MSRQPSLFLFLALFLLVTTRPAWTAEWDVGVAAHTGARGQIRPCT